MYACHVYVVHVWCVLSVDAHMPWHTCEGHRTSSDVSLCFLPCCSQLCKPDCRNGEFRVMMLQLHLRVCCCIGNSGCQACVASALPTEPSSHCPSPTETSWIQVQGDTGNNCQLIRNLLKELLMPWMDEQTLTWQVQASAPDSRGSEEKKYLCSSNGDFSS